MRKKHLVFLFLLMCRLLSAQSEKIKAFQFYDQKGKPISFEKVVNKLQDFDIVLFGEFHNNSMIHWLQLQLTKELYVKKNKNLILGAEMFERDNQNALNDYLKGKINADQLKDSARLWNNFSTDYKPLLDFAKRNQLEFWATNIPRKYASLVYKKAMDSLQMLTTPEEKRWIVQLPFEITLDTPGYKELSTMMQDHSSSANSIKSFVAAQAIKDATMAESIVNAIKNQQKSLFLHFNGEYHSKAYGGIYWYIKRMLPNAKVAVISVFEVNKNYWEVPKKIDGEQKFVPTEINLGIPSDMSKSFDN